MSCQRQILGVKWHDHVKNSDIAATTSLPNVNDITARRRLALFGHVVRLDANTPAHQILKHGVQGVDVKSNGADLLDDHATPGYSNGSLTGIRQSWRAAEDRRHRGSSLYVPPLRMRYDYDDDERKHGKSWQTEVSHKITVSIAQVCLTF